MKDIIVIVGPTGVGKTKLSIELAKRIDAEIINGDSVSIYKELNIGSAKPSMEERENVVHHLFDVVDVSDSYTVYEYQKDVRRLIDDITSRGKRVIIVGGTGLYIRAALYDYKFTEGTSLCQYEELSNEKLVSEIKKYNVLDIPHVNNRQRLVRLLNKLENGEEIATNESKILYPCKFIGLTTERDILYQRINDRVDKMIENGLVEEVKSLKDKYLTSRVLNTGIGYKEFYDYLFEDVSLEKVIDCIKKDSRRFAKRQYTFFNHQFDVSWFEVNFLDFSKTVDEVYNYVIK